MFYTLHETCADLQGHKGQGGQLLQCNQTEGPASSSPKSCSASQREPAEVGHQLQQPKVTGGLPQHHKYFLVSR